jgi:hypothetical protein
MKKRRKGRPRISALIAKTGTPYIPQMTDARGDEHNIATSHVTQFENVMRPCNMKYSTSDQKQHVSL